MAPEKAHALGANIRRLRAAKGLSGNALAKAVGISQGHLWDIETGRARDPGVSIAQALAQALGVTVDELLREVPAEHPIPGTGESNA